ncbi:unnamed protein product [Darwinula stevensoni]|uniref:Uncharacterized protein n=1 Tax=Darwinula stevensoni TaxID=69355 RepID=A0A7R8XC41_9CRUS|nr:unnamed protein product [Darwinula stevensoni]CAG0888460.1 unnamed protein product [Darwinula stevensoni]
MSHGDYGRGGSTAYQVDPHADYHVPPTKPPRSRRVQDLEQEYDADASMDEKAPSERDLSEYSMEIDTKIPHSQYRNGGLVSDHYTPSDHYKSPSELSYYGQKSVVSDAPTSVKSKSRRYGRVEVETMTAPHPACPNTKGVCCLMVLLNLGLLLVILGFIVVLQIRDPLFVWYFGICMLIFGFMTLVGSLIYCVYVCRDRKDPQTLPYGELYWTHHWKKNLDFGGKRKDNEIYYKQDDSHSYRSSNRNDDMYSDYGSNPRDRSRY